ncbi:MAG: hypothetical protein WBV69_12735 [Candidatus Sulfotelmatobacter sp.]
MSILRLLLLSLLVVGGVATLFAQSSSSKIPIRGLPANVESHGSSTSADLSSLNLDDRSQLNQFSVPHILYSEPEQTDTLCLKMRTYKVARDNPHSDSTHAAGYSTCQPAARFQTHTIDGVILPATP